MKRRAACRAGLSVEARQCPTNQKVMAGEKEDLRKSVEGWLLLDQIWGAPVIVNLRAGGSGFNLIVDPQLEF